MERTKQKSKKEKPNKYLEKEKSSSFISDVKAFKENLKIREILKTVKMNSSMRIKAPRGSKVMQNKDFNDNEDLFDDVVANEGRQEDEPPSATNTVLNNENESEIVHDESTGEDEIVPTLMRNETGNVSSVFQKSKSLSDGIDDCSKDDVTTNTQEFPILPAESTGVKSRDRKLSLDHTILLRREGLSQSEVDLNSIGKSPLERKSSFFRKKMDSFVRNTTEIFKRQSMSSKSTRSPVTSRRGSTSSRMSVSLQSLNENSAFFEEFKNVPLNTFRDQQSSVSSLATPRTDSMLSINVNDRLLEQAEVDTMAGSPLPEDQLADTPSTSTHSLNKEPIQDSLLNTRAISMSSGLDTATGQRRRKTSRSNRVSWLASESLTDYFRRLIQDEKGNEVQGWQSYQDFSAIPENRVGSNIDSKGRRLSYMRAVSGEDPSLASSFRKKKHMESEGPRTLSDLERQLASYLIEGIPPLKNYVSYDLAEEPQYFLKEAATEESFKKFFPRRGKTTPAQETQNAILQELVITEAQYIQHLNVIVDLYMAIVHSLQDKGFLLDLNACMIFSHMPDIYNSAKKFWEITFYPLLKQAKEDGRLDPELIIPGFLKFSTIFEPYINYMQQQTTSTEYFRMMNLNPEFAGYINWCHQQADNRLQLPDILIKPVQRLTKYGLIIARLANNVTDKVIGKKLKLVEYLVKSYVSSVNRSVRQSEEFGKLEEMRIDAYEPDYRGDDKVEKICRQHAVIDLFLPMIDCGSVGRCLIYSGIMRYKDSMKEFDAHVLLFTDMMLICKKLPKIKEKDKEKFKKEYKEYSHWKMLRPKIMLNRLLPCYVNKEDLTVLIYLILDELGSSLSVFQLSESPKDTLGANTAKIWQMKIFEAMVTYVLTKWYVKHPRRVLSAVERTPSIEDSEKCYSRKREAAITAVEKRARERVAAMLYGTEKSEAMPESFEDTELELRLMTEYGKYYPEICNSQAANYCSTICSAIYADTVCKAQLKKLEKEEAAASSQPTASVSTVPPEQTSSAGTAAASGVKAHDYFSRALTAARDENRPPNIHALFDTGIAQCVARPPPTIMQNVAVSSAGSSMLRSSSELQFSMSGGSHDEQCTGQAQRSSSVEPNRPVLGVGDVPRSPEITVQMVPENTHRLPSPLSVRAPTLTLQESSPNHSPGPRSASAGAGSDNTLRVASAATLVHSMPDINSEIRRILSANLEPKPAPLSASERLYRSHHELMCRNRLAASQHFLKPDLRGSSYPPPSPRALQRGNAVSFSFPHHPPLTRTKNVPERGSTSQLESTRRIFGRRSPQSDLATGAKSPRRQRSPSPIPRAVLPPGEKPEKKKSLFLRRSKDSQINQEYDESDADDRSRHYTLKKGEKVAGVVEDAGGSSTDDQTDVESHPPKKDKTQG